MSEHCFVCGFENEHALEEHHIIPRSLGGTDDEDNIVLLCANCHRAISSMYSKWFFARLWRKFDEMDTPPKLVRKNPPKGFKYNDEHELIKDYEDGFTDVLKAIELRKRGYTQEAAAKKSGIGNGTVQRLDNEQEYKQMYLRRADEDDFEMRDLSHWGN